MTAYPKELLPQRNYAHSLQFDRMLDFLPLTVMRRSDVKIDYSAINRLPENCITKEDVVGLSMNLLGGSFKAEEHLRYRTKGRGNENWDGETISDVKEGDYEIVKVESPVYFSCKEIHRVSIPYERHFNKRQDWETYHKNSSDVSYSEMVWRRDSPYEVCGEIYIVHKPTRMNYWHVELQISELEGKGMYIERTKANWNRCLRRKVVDHLRRNYLSPDKVEEYTIPENMYKKEA